MEHSFDNNLVMVAELMIRPDRREEFLEYTIQNLALSRTAAGNIEFDILLDETRPNQVLFYEVWESAEAQQTYMAWRVERGDLTILMSFLDAEPKFTALQRVAS